MSQLAHGNKIIKFSHADAWLLALPIRLLPDTLTQCGELALGTYSVSLAVRLSVRFLEVEFGPGPT